MDGEESHLKSSGMITLLVSWGENQGLYWKYLSTFK